MRAHGAMRQLHILTLLLALVLFVLGCATPEAAGRSEGPPDWVQTPPRGDGTNEYFVGVAGDSAGDVAEAETVATAAMIDEIVRYMGVRITTDTTAEARASLDAFESSVVQTVRQTGAARVAGFRVVDRYVERRGEAVTVYLLGAYERASLETERARLQALFQERIDAVAVPEQRAREFEARGQYFEAVLHYLEAAQAAATSDIDNAEIRFERNVNSARNLVSRIQLEKQNDNLIVMVREAFPESFEAVVRVNGRPVPGAAVRVSYKEFRGGRSTTRTTTIQSDEHGRVSFAHPIPQLVGSDTVTVGLDLSRFMLPLEELGREYRSHLDGLSGAISDTRVVFRYDVRSRAAQVPTGVLLHEADIAGNPIAAGTVGSSLQQELSSASFRVQNLSAVGSRSTGMARDELLELLRAEYGGRVERVIIGSAQIDEFNEGDGFIVRVSGSAEAIDLETGEVLYSTSGFQRSRGASSNAAIQAAFRMLGSNFGQDFASRLP